VVGQVTLAKNWPKTYPAHGALNKKPETQNQNKFFFQCRLDDLTSLLRVEQLSSTIDWQIMELQSEAKMGSFHANSTSASMGTISDFSQNCTKCASMGAMKNPHVSDQNSKWFRFYRILNCKGHNPFLPSWITMLILKGLWKLVASLFYKLLV